MLRKAGCRRCAYRKRAEAEFLCPRCREDRAIERAQKRLDSIDAAISDEFAAKPDRGSSRDAVGGVVLAHDPRLADLLRQPAQVRHAVLDRAVRQALAPSLGNQRLDVPALEPPRPQGPVAETVQRLRRLRQDAPTAPRAVRSPPVSLQQAQQVEVQLPHLDPLRKACRVRFPTLVGAAASVNDRVVIKMLNALAAVVAGAFAQVVVGFVIGAASPRRPRPAAATAAGDRSFEELSSNGRPVALLSRHPDPAHVRYCPSTRIPSPSHAAAAACLPTSGPPAFGTLRAARFRTTPRTTTWCAATPECSPAGAVSRAHGSLAVGGMPPPARYRERGVPCLAMRRPPMLRCCSEALFSTIRCHHTPGSSSRQSRLWRQ